MVLIPNQQFGQQLQRFFVSGCETGMRVSEHFMVVHQVSYEPLTIHCHIQAGPYHVEKWLCAHGDCYK